MIIKWIVGAILGPFIRIGEKYLDNQKDLERLKAGTTRVAYQTDAAVRMVKFGSLLGQLPLFVAEMSVSVYIASIMFDSTFPTDLVDPLELPEWFKEHFSAIVASVVGLAVFERVARRFK